MEFIIGIIIGLLLALVIWVVQRDHNVLLNTRLNAQVLLDEMAFITAPWSSSEIEKEADFLLELYKDRAYIYEQALKKDLYKLKLFGYDDLSPTITEYKPILDDLFQQLILAKMTNSTEGIDTLKSNKKINVQIKTIQEKIDKELKSSYKLILMKKIGFLSSCMQKLWGWMSGNTKVGVDRLKEKWAARKSN